MGGIVMDSYAKKLIDRFWEERRLSYPHPSLLYDTVKELCEITDTSEQEKQQWFKILEVLRYVSFQGQNPTTSDSVSFEPKQIKIPIEIVEDLVIRNTNLPLDQYIETNNFECTLQELLYYQRLWIRQITRLCSTVATRYYYDTPRQHTQATKEVMERI